MSLPRRPIPLVALLAGLWMLSAPVGARAELSYPPSQTVADRGTWLPFAPAPPQPAGICMIDSGVEINPDTQPALIAREALDGGDPGDVSPIKHGTLMAMEAAAPPNGWGMIGAAPTAVRIVSIRAESTTDALTFSAYKQAINRCQALAATYNIKVVSLSLGFQGQPTPEQLAQLSDAASRARNYGLDVLAAAGDEGSQTISFPAAEPPIVAVGAAGADRTPCSFSNTGPQLALLAPGCDLQEADPVSGAPLDEYAGTSQATAITAAVLAALRAYQPRLGPVQAEQLLTSTARSAGGSLDVTSLFQSAGLNSVVEAGVRNETSLATATPPPRVSARTVPAPRLPRPRVSIHRRGNTLLLRFLNLPPDGKAMLSVFSRKRGHRRVELARMATRHRTVRLQARANALLSISYAPLQANRARTSQAKVIGL
jgi:hypothetical protein